MAENSNMDNSVGNFVVTIAILIVGVFVIYKLVQVMFLT
jgi:hypothetical protein